MQLSSRQHMRQLFVSLEKDAEVILPRKRNANICRPGSRLLHAVCRIDVYDDVLAVQEYQPVLVSEVVGSPFSALQYHTSYDPANRVR